MIALSEVIERLKDVLSKEICERKVYDKDIALELGINQVTFASMKRRGRIPYEEILAFCARHRISINWLLFDQNPESLIESTHRYRYIRFLPEVHASAGGGAENSGLLSSEDQEERIVLEERMAMRLGGGRKSDEIEAIQVTGDSMEPTLHDGDLVFVDRQALQLSKGGIYVIQTEYGTFIKRLQQRVDGRVDVISDNKDYPVQVLQKEAIDLLGRVVGLFGRPA